MTGHYSYIRKCDLGYSAMKMKVMTSNSPAGGSASILRNLRIVDRLLHSNFFISYQKCFQAMTGLPLELHATDDEEVTACRGSANQNKFCQLLNGGKACCEGCLAAQNYLLRAGDRRVLSIVCFAGLQETAVSITVDSQVVAQLKTGQIFHELPGGEDFKKVAGSLGDEKAGAAELEKAYFETLVIDKQRYQAMITLLAACSLQLTKLANQFARDQECEEEDVIESAKDYIEENLIDEISLDQVSAEIGMSTFHFCRKFKKATGRTLTSFVSERRVELAKEGLLESNKKIIDIAYESGFQSLSQFNRTFHKVTGMNPTEYRKLMA